MNDKLISKLDWQGRFTIPKEVREALELSPHDFVSIQAGDGVAIVKKINIASV